MGITDHTNWDEINQFGKKIQEVIKKAQADYYVKKKIYFQGLTTPTIESGQLDGGIDKNIAYGLKPVDQEDSWFGFAGAFFNETAKFPVHVSTSVHGDTGWSLRLEFWKEGLGPDAYGSTGDLWVFVHKSEDVEMGGIFDEWYIEVGGE